MRCQSRTWRVRMWSCPFQSRSNGASSCHSVHVILRHWGPISYCMGKTDWWYAVVLAVSYLNLCSFTALVRWLAGENKHGSAAMGVPPLILCSIIILAFFLLSCSVDQPSLCSISVTLLRLRQSELHVATLLPIPLGPTVCPQPGEDPTH